jgi:hypothetical protein
MALPVSRVRGAKDYPVNGEQSRNARFVSPETGGPDQENGRRQRERQANSLYRPVLLQGAGRCAAMVSAGEFRGVRHWDVGCRRIAGILDEILGMSVGGRKGPGMPGPFRIQACEWIA